MSIRMDLHCHSSYSDGTHEPACLVAMARRAKLRLLALADHDTMDGVDEALKACEGSGVLLIPAVEFDCESPFELHILGLNVDPRDQALIAGLDKLKGRRKHRNASIERLLYNAGMDIRPFLQSKKGNTTRLHIAKALVDGGFASDVTDAFIRYLNKGRPGYYHEERYTPSGVISLIHGAGGLAVLAHPCHIRANVHTLVRELKGLGLDGIEAYYPASTARQTELYVSLAAQHALGVTCGSDYHGRNREGNPLGCAWRDVDCLNKTAKLLLRSYGLEA